ncbi:MAG: MBL fold metallo-hydrolase [Ferruginibacter sp.]
MNAYTINTGYFKLDGGAMFGVVPKSMWNKLNPADENNMCTWALRCLLIEDGNRLILVDNGIGDKQDDRFFSHYYLHGDDTFDKSLNKYGFSRNDITDVILTHLHFDHCGGSIIREGDKLVPAFKNAVYWSNERHWKWATQPNDREKASFLKENILPIQESGQLKFIERDACQFPRKYQHPPGIRAYRCDDAATIQIQRKNHTFYGRPASFCGAYSTSLCNGLRYVSTDYAERKEVFSNRSARERLCTFPRTRPEN